MTIPMVASSSFRVPPICPPTALRSRLSFSGVLPLREFVNDNEVGSKSPEACRVGCEDVKDDVAARRYDAKVRDIERAG